MSTAVVPKSACVAGSNPTGGGKTGNLNIPSGGAAGDTIGIIFIDASNATVNTITSTPASIINTAAQGTMNWGWLTKVLTSGDVSTGSIAVTFTNVADVEYVSILLDHTVYSGFGTVGTVTGKSGTTGAVVCASTGSAGTPMLVGAVDKATHTTTTAPTASIGSQLGFAQGVISAAHGSVYLATYDTTSAVSADTVTFNTASANGVGFQIPVILAAVPVTITPPAGQATGTGTVPVITYGITTTPPAGQATATGTVPAASFGITNTPPAGQAAATGTVPAISHGYSVVPPAGQATATATAPGFTVGSAVTITPPAAQATATGGVPAFSVGVTLTPPTGQATASAAAPAPGYGVTIVPPAAQAVATATPPRAITIAYHPDPARTTTPTGPARTTTVGQPRRTTTVGASPRTTIA